MTNTLDTKPASGLRNESDATVDTSPACRYAVFLLEDDSEQSRNWKCPHVAERDGLCLFHLPKTSSQELIRVGGKAAEDTDKLEARCRAALAALIDEIAESDTTAAHEFVGFEVPAGFGASNRAFLKAVNFRHARFRGDVHFFKCEMHRADFRDVEFHGRASFLYTVFYGSALLHRATFYGPAEFLHVKYEGQAFFSNARFKDSAEFASAPGHFRQYVNFQNATFDGKAAFIGYGTEPLFLGRANFRQLTVGANGGVSFINVSLAQAEFEDTDLRLIRLLNVSWSSLGGRPSLWGEFRLIKVEKDPAKRQTYGIHDWEAAPDIAKLAENYAQLVLNYEGRRDVEMAEAFHIGEMEMRRIRVASRTRSPLWGALRKNLMSSFAIYRLSSLYGTSYIRAALALGAMVVLFSLILLFTGFAPTKENLVFVNSRTESSLGPRLAGSQTTEIEYDLMPDSEHRRATASEWFSDASQAFLFTLSIVTFQRDRFFEPTSQASQLWTMIAVVVIAGQAALLLFAVRRRFKR